MMLVGIALARSVTDCAKTADHSKHLGESPPGEDVSRIPARST